MLAQYGDKLSSANRPDPDDPGGLGAEESGAERTGSTQEYLLAIQHGGRWAEVGQYYDSANDPVTVAALFCLANRAICSVGFPTDLKPARKRTPCGVGRLARS